MKRFNNFKKPFYLMLLCLLFSLSFNNSVKACVSDTTIITTIVSYSPDFSEVEIRLGNLKLGTETPNVFCTCALTSVSTIFTNLQYVAFVDAGTNNVYGNFAPWTTNTAASDAWDNDQSSYPDWTGFIAEVINGGLVTNTPVEMVIRAELPLGYTAVVLDSTISSTYVGTDKWDDVNQVLDNAHQKVRNLVSDASSYQSVEMPLSYFEALDGQITGVRNLASSLEHFNIQPNPVTNEIFFLDFSLKTESPTTLELTNLNGQVVGKINLGIKNSGEHLIELNTKDYNLNAGIYQLSIITDGEIHSRKFVVMK